MSGKTIEFMLPLNTVLKSIIYRNVLDNSYELYDTHILSNITIKHAIFIIVGMDSIVAPVFCKPCTCTRTMDIDTYIIAPTPTYVCIYCYIYD